jgi:hypothetical protein
MSKPKSYLRLSDGAMMVEVEVDKHQYVNAKVLQAQGRNPAGRKHRVVAGCARAAASVWRPCSPTTTANNKVFS